MTALITNLRRAVAALVVCGGLGAAQETTTPRIHAGRVAGELGAGAVGFTLGAEGALVAAAGVAYLLRGHGGDIDDPRMIRALTPVLWVGGGVGAGTGAWLASRTNGQSSRWRVNVLTSTAVSALAFRYAGWPLTSESRERQRAYGAWRRVAPVWMTAVTAAAVATATRQKKVPVVDYPQCCGR